jgi:c-di-GMP-binding flagellar brake protein YcgR
MYMDVPNIPNPEYGASHSTELTRQSRRYVRKPADFRVRLSYYHSGKTRQITVRTYELSLGGLSVYAADDLAINTSVTLTFTLPCDTESMRLVATVRNRNGFRYGIEFQPMSSLHRERLSVFCNQIPA